MEKRIKRQTIKHIPQDIIEDILVNLPVKSLLRFKCVSKPWRSLISSKHFTKAHLKKSTDLIRHNLIYSSSYDYERTYRALCSRSLRSCPLRSFLDEQNYEDYSVVATSYHNSFMPNSGFLEDIIGSCNGLILFTSKIAARWRDLILWNPSTRQVRIIPPPRYYARRKRYNRWHRFVYGFGYDDSSDDYKVVIIFVSKSGPYRTQMYSMRTNSWRKIGDFEKGRLVRCSGTHVNGKLHWLVEKGGFGGNKIIVSLSLVDGKYDIVDPPLQYSEYNHDSYYASHDLGGYLSLMSNDSISGVKIWAMMKYGEVESWTKVGHVISYLERGRPIWLSKNGDVVVAFSGWKVVVSNGKNKSRVYAVDAEILQQDNIYVESLVSPFGDKTLCQ